MQINQSLSIKRNSKKLEQEKNRIYFKRYRYICGFVSHTSPRQLGDSPELPRPARRNNKHSTSSMVIIRHSVWPGEKCCPVHSALASPIDRPLSEKWVEMALLEGQ